MAEAVPIALSMPKPRRYSTNEGFDSIGTIGTHSRAGETLVCDCLFLCEQGLQAAPALVGSIGLSQSESARQPSAEEHGYDEAFWYVVLQPPDRAGSVRPHRPGAQLGTDRH